jgi:hypothetical protein
MEQGQWILLKEQAGKYAYANTDIEVYLRLVNGKLTATMGTGESQTVTWFDEDSEDPAYSAMFTETVVDDDIWVVIPKQFTDAKCVAFEDVPVKCRIYRWSEDTLETLQNWVDNNQQEE